MMDSDASTQAQKEDVSSPHSAKGAPPWNAAFERLFRTEFAYVCHSLRRLGVPSRDVEDLAHEVFLAVHARFADYDATRAPRPWLFAFAVRVAQNFRRLARNRREVADEPHDRADETALADEQLAARQKRDLVLRALESVDFDRRAVLVMHDIDGLAMPEIATALGLPLNTAYSRLRIARDEFRTAAQRLRRARGES